MSAVHRLGIALPGGHRPRPLCPCCPGLALDLGSSRTRAWISGRGMVLDAPTITFPDARLVHPVQRGAIVDVPATARMLDRLLGDHMPRRARPLVVVTTPVLHGPAHREQARAVVQVLRPRAVLTLPTARAVAHAADADPGRPLLVADIGARLSEVVLLAGGAVVDARSAALGTGDLVDAGDSEELGDAVVAMITSMVRQDRTALTATALKRGALLAGGGALLADLAPRLVAGLRAPVTAVPDPHTAALRGAAGLLRSAHAHPSVRATSRTACGPMSS
ncbi:rod shape-determining protein [Streptomyces erythrochromogenes]|uniref:rod shape-determining protein n=1 Tax=Streptomyces erythrochromogenes TaxID=285574 RepID=UPI0036FCDDF1